MRRKKKIREKELRNLIAAIACEGQEIDELAIGDGAMLAEIWEFGSPHQADGERSEFLPWIWKMGRILDSGDIGREERKR